MNPDYYDLFYGCSDANRFFCDTEFGWAREAVKKRSAGVPPAGQTRSTFVVGGRDARATSGAAIGFLHGFERPCSHDEK